VAKLYFRYGTVGSAKSMNLLAVAHNYRQQQKKVILVKPTLDVRFGIDVIKSRSGLNMEADIIVDDDSAIDTKIIEGVHCILVDEAQFLSVGLVNQLRDISRNMDIPVICYGLRTDFRTHLFPGSKRLLELSDSVEEIKTTCAFCNRKAVFNLKFVEGKPTTEGPRIDLGAEEKYLPACSVCYCCQLELESRAIFSDDHPLHS
jgi:thymidine kinase